MHGFSTRDTALNFVTMLMDRLDTIDVAGEEFLIDPALGGAIPQPDPNVVQQPTAMVNGEPMQLTSDNLVAHDAQHNEVQTMADETSSQRSSRRAGLGEDPDAELRRLAGETTRMSIHDLARQVRDDENSPQAERSRQVFGMKWLLTSCEKVADTSVAVPRNRVYARYVAFCANERIKPLNPASFGKLVRLIYPEIKTRRLGVRGQSKYHYCGIRLINDTASPAAPDSVADPAALEEHLHV